jgi:hypothetical protein
VKRVAVIACDHGLGHVRRAVLIADEIARLGGEPTILAPNRAVDRMRSTLHLEQPAIPTIDFSTQTSPEALRSGDRRATHWEQRLPDLDRFDHVVCDTLPEIIAIRPDAVLVAQFLWHDVIEGADRAYAERAQQLAIQAELIAGSLPFAMPVVRSMPGFVGVGLHLDRRTVRSAVVGEDLLVTGGSTPAVSDFIRRSVSMMVAHGPGHYRRVLVEQSILPDDAPSWLVAADHSTATYDTLAAALIRPGLGVVTELLARSVPMWCIFEPRNSELSHNAAALDEMRSGVVRGPIGASSMVPDEVLAKLVEEVMSGPPDRGDRAPDGLTFDGSATVASFVLKRTRA